MPDVQIKNNKLGKTKLRSGLSIRKGQTLTIPYAVASSPRVQRYIQKGLFSVVNNVPVPAPTPPPIPECETDPPAEPAAPAEPAPPAVVEHSEEPIIKKKRGLRRKKQSEPE